jgi:arginine decarboxylase
VNQLNEINQNSTPLFDAVKRYVDSNVIPFHVPGHKHGRGIRELREYAGERILEMDVNGMDDLDYANNPTGVIAQSQKLLADAFGAENAYFLVNGTTSGVQAMIMSVCEPGSKIIIPRNAHKSTIGAVILSGAIPVYVQPVINKELGIAMGVTTKSVEDAIKNNPSAKAVFVINPTYYGIASDLKSIVSLAHDHEMAVLVDEAHGAHMYFHSDFPMTAMKAGADASAVSIHKTAGSLTQSSALLLKSKIITPAMVKRVMDLTYTSSASYLLMCSIDIARKQLAIDGKTILEEVLKLSRDARKETNKISGLYAFGSELIGTPGLFGFDETKLGINIAGLGYTGWQFESKLRKEYNIQIELSDANNVLAIISLGDRKQDLELLISALKDISANAKPQDYPYQNALPDSPEMVVCPRDAFHSPQKTVSLENSIGEISGEMIMAYPPGIPVICMGERITKDIVEYIKMMKNERCQIQGTADPYVDYVKVLGSR